MYRHLLVPIDQSELSIINVGEAVKLARSLGAKVTFFHANVDYSTTVQGFRSRAQTEDRLHRTSQFLGGSVPAEPTPEPTTDQYREHTLAQSRPLLAKAGAAAASKTVAYSLAASVLLDSHGSSSACLSKASARSVAAAWRCAAARRAAEALRRGRVARAKAS